MERPSADNQSLTQQVHEYFLHIREPEIVEPPQSKVELDQLLGEYEEGLLFDANFYRDHPELLQKKSTPFFFSNEIDHLQFLSSQDRYTAWAVEMKLEKLKDSTLWRPASTRFVRFSRAQIELLKSTWIGSDRFLYHYRDNGYYDEEKLDDDVFSHILIETDKGGRIARLDSQERQEFASVNQKITLKNNDTVVPESLPDAVFPTVQLILSRLPIGKVSHHNPLPPSQQ